MTVCVAGFASGSSTIIAVSDRRITVGDMAADVETVEKAHRVHGSWIAMVAGNDIGNATPILDQVKRALAEVATKSDTVGRVDVAREFRRAFRAHHHTIIEERVLAPYGLSVAAFREKGFKDLGPHAFDELRHAVEAIKVDCEFLVCGFSENQPQLFVISDQGLSYYDQVGYWAIGSGAWSALSSLAFRKYHRSLEFSEAVYQILEAKFMADTAVPTVGKSTFTLIIMDGKIGYIDDVERVREIWLSEGQPRTPTNLAARMPPISFGRVVNESFTTVTQPSQKPPAG
jgi:hypothetical protein